MLGFDLDPATLDTLWKAAVSILSGVGVLWSFFQHKTLKTKVDKE